MPLEERGIRQFLSHRGLHADDLRLDPDARDHAGILDGVDDLDNALLAREPGLGRHPFANGRPPVAGVVVPAAVDDEDSDAGLAGGLDKRKLLLGGRIAIDGVHVIVEHHARFRVVTVRRAHFATVVGDVGDNPIKVVGDSEGRRHCGEGFAKMEFLAPGVVLVGRAGQRHAAVRGVVLYIPAPCAVMFDLKQPCQLLLLGFEDGQRNVGARGPRAGGHYLVALARVDFGELLADGRNQIAHRLAVPAAFGQPVETAFEQIPIAQIGFGAFRSIRRQAECAAPARDGIQQHGFEAHVGDRHIGLHHRSPVIDAVADRHLQIAVLVFQHDLQLVAMPDDIGLVAAVAQFAADNRVGEFVAGNHMTRIGGHDFGKRRLIREANGGVAYAQAGHGNRLVVIVCEDHGHRTRIPREVLGHRYLHQSTGSSPRL